MRTETEVTLSARDVPEDEDNVENDPEQKVTSDEEEGPNKTDVQKSGLQIWEKVKIYGRQFFTTPKAKHQ